MTHPIHVFRTLHASPSSVFDAWVAPATLIAPVTRVEMDVRPGGAIRISTGTSDGNELDGRFLEVAAARRLRYTWRWRASREETVVAVDFHAVDDVTIVELDHRGFLDESSRRNHLEGWAGYLEEIGSFL